MCILFLLSLFTLYRCLLFRPISISLATFVLILSSCTHCIRIAYYSLIFLLPFLPHDPHDALDQLFVHSHLALFRLTQDLQQYLRLLLDLIPTLTQVGHRCSRVISTDRQQRTETIRFKEQGLTVEAAEALDVHQEVQCLNAFEH